jgi:hypothetical protein
VPPTVPSSDDVIATLRAPVEVDIESLRRRIEENTQAEVERIRKGPAGLLAVSFAPTSPPRTESDLMRIVELLRELPEFRSVEPERRYRAQQGPAVPQK